MSVSRSRQHQEILEPLLPGLTGCSLRLGQRLIGRGPGGGTQRAPLGPAAPTALHAALPHPRQSPGQACCADDKPGKPALHQHHFIV